MKQADLEPSTPAERAYFPLLDYSRFLETLKWIHLRQNSCKTKLSTRSFPTIPLGHLTKRYYQVLSWITEALESINEERDHSCLELLDLANMYQQEAEKQSCGYRLLRMREILSDMEFGVWREHKIQ